VSFADLLERISAEPGVYGGQPCVCGTRIHIAIMLDSLGEGLSPEEIVDHCPHLTPDDIHAALACAGELAHVNRPMLRNKN
jgi:uncharacterized protein (DUF433 family)